MIIISNQEKINQTIAKIKADGIAKLHFLADFDKTLTKLIVKGRKMPSFIAQLRDGNYLTENYATQAQALYDQYHPIEIDPNIAESEKKQAMHDWWQQHFELLINSGLNKKDIIKVTESELIQLREGTVELLKNLSQLQIPLVILSSAGLGYEPIELLLKKNNCYFKNIKVISNELEYDQDGKVIKRKEPIIHTLNKDETLLADFPFYPEIENRKNVVLLGDSLSDLKMITGFDYDNLIKIGFLNENVEANLDKYKDSYDVVITDDGDMGYVNELLAKITK